MEIEIIYELVDIADDLNKKTRPLKNAYFCLGSRKEQILTAGRH